MTKPRLIADSANNNSIDGDRILDTSVSASKLGGTELIPSQSLGYTNASNQAIERTVRDRLGDYVSVLDFGADPTGATDSTVSIKNALVAAGSQKSLFFPPGTYIFTDQLVVFAESIVGVPGYSILKAGTTTYPFSTTPTWPIQVGNCRVEGLIFDMTFFTSANKASYPSLSRFIRVNAGNLYLIDCQVLGNDTFDINRAVDLNGAQVVTVKGCLIQNIRGEALAAVGRRLLITNNRIINVKKNSGFANRAVIAGQTEDMIFTDNYIQDTEWATNVFDSVCAIDCGGGDRIVVSNNIFKNVAVGTDFEASSSPAANQSTDIICSNNVFTGNGTNGNGIWMNFAGVSANRVVISNNTVTGFSTNIAASIGRNVTITGNVLTGAVNAGIFLDGTYDFVVSDNLIESTSTYGIRTQSTNDNFSGGIISNNCLVGEFSTAAISCSNYSSASGTGSTLLPRQPVQVINNIVHDTQTAASKDSRIETIGNVISVNNASDVPTPFTSSFDIGYGNLYSVNVSGNQTLSGLTNGSFGQTVEISFRVFSGSSLTIDFTSSNLVGNNGSDLVVSATGPERQVLLIAKRVFTGFGNGKWICQVSY